MLVRCRDACPCNDLGPDAINNHNVAATQCKVRVMDRSPDVCTSLLVPLHACELRCLTESADELRVVRGGADEYTLLESL